MWCGRWVAVTASSSLQVRADARGDRLLPGRQVHLPGDQPRPDVERWLLVRVVLAEDGFLVGAAEHHHLVELKTGLVVHDASLQRAGSMP